MTDSEKLAEALRLLSRYVNVGPSWDLWKKSAHLLLEIGKPCETALGRSAPSSATTAS